MAHAAAHLKKARELEQHPDYRALQKAREKRRRQRERAERKRQVKSVTRDVYHDNFITTFCGGLIIRFGVTVGQHEKGLWDLHRCGGGLNRTR